MQQDALYTVEASDDGTDEAIAAADDGILVVM